MGAGIAQVAAQAGHPVHLVDAVPGAAAAAARAPRRDPGPAGRQGPDQPRRRRRGHRPADRQPTTVADLPAVRPGDRGDRARTSPPSGRSSPSWRSVSRPTRCSRRNTSSLDITAIADGIAHPGRVLGLHFFNPPPLMRLVEVVHGDADRRRRASSGPPTLMRAWGKTPVRCTSTPGLHRQPGRPPLLRRGPADGRGGRGRPRHHRLRPARAGRVPDGAAGADRPDRPGRQPRRRHVGLGADRPRRALRPHRLPAPPRRGRPPRPQDAVAASSRTTTPAAPRGSCPTRSWPGGSWPARS